VAGLLAVPFLRLNSPHAVACRALYLIFMGFPHFQCVRYLGFEMAQYHRDPAVSTEGPFRFNIYLGGPASKLPGCCVPVVESRGNGAAGVNLGWAGQQRAMAPPGDSAARPPGPGSRLALSQVGRFPCPSGRPRGRASPQNGSCGTGPETKGDGDWTYQISIVHWQWPGGAGAAPAAGRAARHYAPVPVG
jgi:hypothetical protein